VRPKKKKKESPTAAISGEETRGGGRVVWVEEVKSRSKENGKDEGCKIEVKIGGVQHKMGREQEERKRDKKRGRKDPHNGCGLPSS